MKKLVLVGLVFLVWDFVFVVGEPYLNENCSEGEIRKVWESVFREGYNGVNLNILKNNNEECGYLVSKNNVNEYYILTGKNLISDEKKTEFKFIYVNGSVEGGVIVEGVSEMDLIEFGYERNISNINEAEEEFDRVFKIVDSGAWGELEGSEPLVLYGSDKWDSENKINVVKTIFENISINMLYYSIKEDLDNKTKLEFSKDIENIFIERGREISLNIKIYLENPEELSGLSYRVVGVKNARVIFKGDIMTIKLREDYDGFEKIWLYVKDKDGNEIRSNEFYVFVFEEGDIRGGGENNYSEIENESDLINESGEKEEKGEKEEDSFSWVLIGVFVLSGVVVVLFFVLIYFLFVKDKEEVKEDEGEVNSYIKNLEMD